MNIVTVAPISKGVILPELTYFTKNDPPVGSTIIVSVRSKKVPGLVLDVSRAEDMKISIRKGGGLLKKVIESKPKFIFTDAFIEASKETANFFLCTLGQVIDSYAPKMIFEDMGEKPIFNNISRQDESIKAISANKDDRLSFYKIYIREQFAKGKSVFIYVPHHIDGVNLFNALSLGIEPYSFLMHGEVPLKKAKTEWKRAIKEKHPILFIATSKFLALPRSDIGTYIIESDSKSHKSINRPFLDSRFFVKTLAKKSGASLIYEDTTLSLETTKSLLEGKIEALGNLKHRLRHPTEIKIVDLKQESKNPKIKFSVFKEDVKNQIIDFANRNEKIFIFCNRKGLAPTTICEDCGSTLDCEKCRVPLVLIKGEDKREFQCLHCKKITRAETRCNKCKSWRLYPLGIGIERVIDELENLLPGIPIFKIESGTTKTPAQVTKTIKEFYEANGGILVGTEQAIPYLLESIPLSVVVSVDNMLSLPDYSTPERLFSLLLYIYEQTSKNLIIQSRKPHISLFEFIANKDVKGFQGNELKIRKEYGYPPYNILVKLTLQGKEEVVKNEVQNLSDRLKSWDPIVTPAFIHHKKGYFSMHIIFKADLESWPKSELAILLKSLPPSYIIDVNPQSLL